MSFRSEFDHSVQLQFQGVHNLFVQFPPKVKTGSQLEAKSNHKPMQRPLEHAVKQDSLAAEFRNALKPLKRQPTTMRPMTANSPKIRPKSGRPNTAPAPSRPDARTNPGENRTPNSRCEPRRLSNNIGKKLAELDASDIAKRPHYDIRSGTAHGCGDNGYCPLAKPVSAEGTVRKKKNNEKKKKLYRSSKSKGEILTDANPIPKMSDKPKRKKKPSLDSEATCEDVPTQSGNTDVTKAVNGIKNKKTKSKDFNGNPVPETKENWEADVSKPIKLWKNFRVYYDPIFSDSELTTIKYALSKLEKILPSVKFHYLSSKPTKRFDYIWIKKGDKGSGCNSFVGRQGGEQIINLECPGCIYVDIVIHEIVHALGLAHEHQRPDRDEYININRKNIEEGNEDAFEKLPATRFPTLSFGFPYNLYDVKSITHYYSTAFSKNERATMSNKNRKLFPRRVELTKLDTLKLQALYGCVDKKVLDAVLESHSKGLHNLAYKNSTSLGAIL